VSCIHFSFPFCMVTSLLFADFVSFNLSTIASLSLVISIEVHYYLPTIAFSPRVLLPPPFVRVLFFDQIVLPP